MEKEKVNRGKLATMQKLNAVKVLEFMNPKIIDKSVNQSNNDGKEI